MPAHPDRVRCAPLPAGYQFGDGSGLTVVAVGSLWPPRLTSDAPGWRPTRWRAPHENAADQLERFGVTANVIEGDHH